MIIESNPPGIVRRNRPLNRSPGQLRHLFHALPDTNLYRTFAFRPFNVASILFYARTLRNTLRLNGPYFHFVCTVVISSRAAVRLVFFNYFWVGIIAMVRCGLRATASFRSCLRSAGGGIFVEIELAGESFEKTFQFLRVVAVRTLRRSNHVRS